LFAGRQAAAAFATEAVVDASGGQRAWPFGIPSRVWPVAAQAGPGNKGFAVFAKAAAELRQQRFPVILFFKKTQARFPRIKTVLVP
jgi:hypothetical protein